VSGPAGVDADAHSLIDGRALAAQIFGEASDEIDELKRDLGSVPTIKILRVGGDAASGVYSRRILKSAHRVGASGEVIQLPADLQVKALRATLRGLSDDTAVGGVIVQLPLPVGLDVRHVIEALDPLKDVDGIHPFNAGLVSRGSIGFAPSCAEAALQILRRTGVPIAGRQAVVIGRSSVVGRPVQQLLLREDATVTVCHRQTRDLARQIREAEIVIAAAGAPGLVTGDWIKPGAVVIDCGINVSSSGSVRGDVDLPSVAPIAAAITPVPGGVGPVTNAVLMLHLARAVRAQRDGGFPDAREMAS